MKTLKKRARRGRLEGNGLCVSIYGLAAGGARAAIHARGAPGARAHAGCEKTGLRLRLGKNRWPQGVLKTINVRTMSGFLFLGLSAAGQKMIKLSIREFKLSGRGGDGLHPRLDVRGAFVGDGVALLAKDILAISRPCRACAGDRPVGRVQNYRRSRLAEAWVGGARQGLEPRRPYARGDRSRAIAVSGLAGQRRWGADEQGRRDA
jgi:hypothetical protein